MAKVKDKCFLVGVLTLLWASSSAQNYPVHYRGGDSLQIEALGLIKNFTNRFDANNYVSGLLALLHNKGFLTASVDSFRFDSSSATVALYVGERYQWGLIRTRSADEALLQAVRFPALTGPMDFAVLNAWQKRLLDYLEDHGHPFGRVYLDSVSIAGDAVSALLKIEQGPAYKIDSLQIFGDAKVSADFLQRYLELPPGAPYSKQKLVAVNKKIAKLAYAEEESPAQLQMLPTGAVLNLYLKAKRSSQINALIGFLPNSQLATGERRFQLTADVNALWRNQFGGGETVSLAWQQLQKSSPRLNLLYEQPYVFRSQFGAQFSLDMYKRDSFFLNLNVNLGVSYRLGDKQTASVFLQRRSTIVNGINAAAIISSKRLPLEADVSSLNLGVGYDFNSTDYRFNPRRGRLLSLTASAGTKKLKKNNLILELKDPSDPAFDFERLYDTVKANAYQFRITANGAQFLPLGGQTALKFGVNAGVYQSPAVFRNELFLIGGNRLLRGFDEESQFVSQYAVGTVEFRLLTGVNSNFFAFADGGWGKYPLDSAGSHTYISAGAGLSFQPKAGLINVTLAVGKRDDGVFNLRQSKIHIGFVSFF